MLFNLQNEDDFDHLYNLYYTSLCIYASTLLKDVTIAQDIVQDSFSQLWSKRFSLPSIGKAYVYKVVHNNVVSYIIKKNWKAKKIKHYSVPVSEEDVQAALIRAEFYGQLKDAVKNLPPKLAPVVRLHYFAEISLKSLAKILNIPFNTVKSRKTSAIKLLRQLIPKS